MAHCNDVSCTTPNEITVVDPYGNTGFFTSIAIGTDGLPVISYYDASSGSLKVVHCIDASCSTDDTRVVSPISSLCGNAVQEQTEACDDGNSVSGDGCSDMCAVESGFSCTSDRGPSVCSRLSVCGNGTVDLDEQCDDGNQIDGDGCTNACTYGILGCILRTPLPDGTTSGRFSGKVRLPDQLQGMNLSLYMNPCPPSHSSCFHRTDTNQYIAVPNSAVYVAILPDGSFSAYASYNTGEHIFTLMRNFTSGPSLEVAQQATSVACPMRDYPLCGDGIREGHEACDSADVRGLSCADYGYSSGEIICTLDCRLSVDHCIR